MNQSSLTFWEAEYHKMMTSPIPAEWPTGIINKLITQNMEQNKTVMADLPVTVQITYGDLKLLEDAKAFGVINPLDKDGRQQACAQVLEVMKEERQQAVIELSYEPVKRSFALEIIDHLINRLSQLP